MRGHAWGEESPPQQCQQKVRWECSHFPQFQLWESPSCGLRSSPGEELRQLLSGTRKTICVRNSLFLGLPSSCLPADLGKTCKHLLFQLSSCRCRRSRNNLPKLASAGKQCPWELNPTFPKPASLLDRRAVSCRLVCVTSTPHPTAPSQW